LSISSSFIDFNDPLDPSNNTFNFATGADLSQNSIIHSFSHQKPFSRSNSISASFSTFFFTNYTVSTKHKFKSTISPLQQYLDHIEQAREIALNTLRRDVDGTGGFGGFGGPNNSQPDLLQGLTRDSTIEEIQYSMDLNNPSYSSL